MWVDFFGNNYICRMSFKISFIVDKDSVVRYALNDSKDYIEAIKASVAVQKGKVYKAADIKDKIYECADGDTTRTLRYPAQHLAAASGKFRQAR